MSIDYTRPVKVDGRTGFVAKGAEPVRVVRGPVREFVGMLVPAAVVMVVFAALVMLSGCGPDNGQTPKSEPNVAASPVGNTVGKSAPDKGTRACKPVPAAHKGLCLSVYRQHAYGMADVDGSSWSSPAGPETVRDIMGMGLSTAEMISYLKAEARNYRDAVTHVSVNMDKLRAKCGNTDGQYVIKFKDEDGKPGGVKLTLIIADCA